MCMQWTNWISGLLVNASTHLNINGDLTETIIHRKGLRHGDPVSPKLFILLIDPMQQILHLASEQGILKPIRARSARCRISLCE